MTNEMGDEKFEEFLQREAKAYNAPPAGVPRDEMFAAISAARKAGNGPLPLHVQRGVRFTRYAWVGMAATLVIGVAIGRFAMSGRETAAPVAARGNATTSGAPADSGVASYTQAANMQLVRAEALLTAYGASPANIGVDKQLSGWARDILSNTRMLLDSPAADDPARRQLLQDLELVLVQMVQRAPTAGSADERSHIDRSLDRTQVLSRLRSALPAGHNNGI